MSGDRAHARLTRTVDGASRLPKTFGGNFARYASELASDIANIKTMLALQEVKEVLREQMSEIVATVQRSARPSIES